MVSAEYMQLFGTAMKECEKCVPPGPDNGRERFITRGASTKNELSWLGAPQYVEHFMRVEDIASHHSLSFEGSEWLLRDPATKEQKPGSNGQAKSWAYKRVRHHVNSWAGKFRTMPHRY